MNKKLLWGAMSLAGMLSFASCSSDDSMESNENLVATGEQVIVLDMQDTDDLVSRSRPLYSTENKGAELVTDVRLFVFKIEGTSRTLENVISVSNWRTNSSEYNYGNKYTLKLTGEDKLELGANYEILAVGQDESDPADAYSIKLTGLDNAVKVAGIEDDYWGTDKPIWSPTSDAGQGFATTVAKDKDTEIYSGISDPINLLVSETGAFNCTVLLKRQVAGVLGYFCNIPGQVNVNGNWTDVKYIRLVASNANTKIDLSHQLHVQLDDATHESPTEEGIENIVNGFATPTPPTPPTTTVEFENGNPAYEVYKIDLTQWFISTAEENASTVWGNNDVSSEEGQGDVRILKAEWKNALDATNAEKVILRDSTAFAGEFVIPFNQIAENNTFELQLLSSEDGSGNTTILKKWDVVLDAASQNDKNTKYNYNIYRNHLYQIGQRGETDKPDEPGVGGDQPQPLDKSQDIVIKINDQWEFIHNMGIE